MTEYFLPSSAMFPGIDPAALVFLGAFADLVRSFGHEVGDGAGVSGKRLPAAYDERIDTLVANGLLARGDDHAVSFTVYGAEAVAALDEVMGLIDG